MEGSTVTLEDNLVVPYKSKHCFTIISNNQAPWYFPKGAENLCPDKTLDTDLIAALFIIAKICTQPSCPPVGEWIINLLIKHPKN